jgi:hypothetical protein
VNHSIIAERRALSFEALMGGPMPTVMVYHNVKDVNHWLASPKRKEIFEPIGVSNIRTFVAHQRPNHVGLTMDVADIDRLMAFMQTKPAADAMVYDGVLPKTLVFLVQS